MQRGTEDRGKDTRGQQRESKDVVDNAEHPIRLENSNSAAFNLQTAIFLHFPRPLPTP